MDEEYSESVDASADMDVSGTDVAEAIPVDIPEDDYSDADDFFEEDSIEPEAKEMHDSIDNFEEDSYDGSEIPPEDDAETDDIPEDSDEIEEIAGSGMTDVEDVPEDTESNEDIGQVKSYEDEIAEDVVNGEVSEETAYTEDTEATEQSENETNTEAKDEVTYAEDVDTADQLEEVSDAEKTDEATDVEGTNIADQPEDVASVEDGNYSNLEAFDYEKTPETQDAVNLETSGEYVSADNPYRERWEGFADEFSGGKDKSEGWESLKDVPFAGDSPSDVSKDSSTAETSEASETPEINSISDYMNAHNYRLDDFATYSQDSQWRQLMHQEYPDYVLPEMMHESANAQLSKYMNDHNYGVNVYAEYSQEPVWRDLHSTAFSDDELTPLTAEEASSKEGIFSSAFGIANDVIENQPINQIFQSEQSASNMTDLNQEFDTSFEAQELRDMGIKNVDLRDCSLEYRGDIVDAVRDMIRENPELIDQLSDVKCYPMQDVTYASYGPTGQGVPFGGRLNLNSKYFSSNTLRADLAGESQQGWSIPNASPRSIVSHELGHGVHLGLCAKSCGITPGTIPESGSYREVVRQYVDDVHADQIVETACSDLGIEFDSWDFANQLTRYGASNYGEAISEAVAEVRNNENPRPMASAIYSRLMQYKNNMNGETLV